MTIQSWLKAATAQLHNAGITTARLDCLVLLEDVIAHDKSWLLAYPNHILQMEELDKLNTLIAQRALHTPLAYLRGKTEFYGRSFYVNTHTLVPRPETEAIIDLLKNLDLPANPTIVDIGTGTGCIAITAALELPNAQVTAIDIDPQCVTTAATNAKNLSAHVHVRHGNLLQDIPETFDVVLANLPYVPDEYPINDAAKHEPPLALFSGADGLDLYRQLFKQLPAHQPKFVVTESLQEQHGTLATLAQTAGFHTLQTKDLVQLFARY